MPNNYRLPIVSVTGALDFVTEDSGIKEIFTIRLSSPAPFGGLKLNIIFFSSEAANANDQFSTSNIVQIEDIATNNGKGSVITSVTIAFGAREASLIFTPESNNVLGQPETNYFYLLPGEGYMVNPNLYFASSTTSNEIAKISV